MYGWRARIGLVVPSNNTVVEPEFGIMAPEGVAAYGARILSSGLAPEAIVRMVENSHRAVAELRAGDMSLIAYACLATSLVKGRGWTDDFLETVRRDSGRPAAAAAPATVAALRALDVSRVALATPYTERINSLLPALFEDAGISIVSLRSRTVENSLAVCRLPSSAAYDLALAADCPEAEAVCILATDFRTVDILDALEGALGKPAISTNQALMWQCLDLAGVEGPLAGFGALLRDRPPAAT